MESFFAFHSFKSFSQRVDTWKCVDSFETVECGSSDRQAVTKLSNPYIEHICNELRNLFRQRKFEWFKKLEKLKAYRGKSWFIGVKLS